MKRNFFALLLSVAALQSFGQKTTRLYEAYFSRPDDMKPDEDGGYYFVVTGNQKVHMSDDGYYKLMNSDGGLLEEGDTDEGDVNFTRHGKWMEYYNNGQIKASGSYFRDEPYGLWSFYDEKGNLKEEFTLAPIVADDGNLTYCKAGAERTFYENGKVKEERFYKAEPFVREDRLQVEDLETGKKVWKKTNVKSYKPQPFGAWTFFNSDGTVARKEDK